MPADAPNFWHLWEFHLLFIFKQFAIWIWRRSLFGFHFFLFFLASPLFYMLAEGTKNAAVNLHNEILRGPRGKWRKRETLGVKLLHGEGGKARQTHLKYIRTTWICTWTIPGICYEAEAFAIWPEVRQSSNYSAKMGENQCMANAFIHSFLQINEPYTKTNKFNWIALLGITIECARAFLLHTQPLRKRKSNENVQFAANKQCHAGKSKQQQTARKSGKAENLFHRTTLVVICCTWLIENTWSFIFHIS